MEEVVNIRRAMDLILSEPNVDSQRFAYVGHDFGGMYGVLAGSLDGRPTHYVVMAATPRFPDWYLYLPKLEGEARAAFIRQMAEIDPIVHVPNLSPAEVFFQFAIDDFHVPKERAEGILCGCKGPKRNEVVRSWAWTQRERNSRPKSLVEGKAGFEIRNTAQRKCPK